MLFNGSFSLVRMRKKWFYWAWLVALVSLPAVLLLLPTDFFDEGETLCPSKHFFDVECWGCGMTRAVMHFLHLDFESALYYNPGSFLVTPVMGIIWVRWLVQAIKVVRQ